MLELYHGGHTTCSRKARLCLKEKGLAYTSHFLNLRGFEQHTPAYLEAQSQRRGADAGRRRRGDRQFHADQRISRREIRPAHAAASEQPARQGAHAGVDQARQRPRPRRRGAAHLADLQGAHRQARPNELQEKLGRIPLTERQERWAKVARGGFGDEPTSTPAARRRR